MKLANPLSFLLTSVVFLGTAMAGGRETSAAASGELRIPAAKTGSGDSPLVPGRSDGTVIVRMGPGGQRIELSPFEGVCFTMRTYKVKPTERLQDNETGTAGYSTCQMGSNYRVRATDTPSSK
jgi:hypothetical protein